jgi:hypothetical protein
MVNLRGSMVPTKHLVPKIDGITDSKNRWKIVGVCKKGFHRSQEEDEEEEGNYFDDEASVVDGDEDDDDEPDEEEKRRRLMDSIRASNHNNNRQLQNNNSMIHDMDLDSGMPPLSSSSTTMSINLENISPVRIEAWMTKVFHYEQVCVCVSLSLSPCTHANIRPNRTQISQETPQSTGSSSASSQSPQSATSILQNISSTPWLKTTSETCIQACPWQHQRACERTRRICCTGYSWVKWSSVDSFFIISSNTQEVEFQTLWIPSTCQAQTTTRQTTSPSPWPIVGSNTPCTARYVLLPLSLFPLPS